VWLFEETGDIAREQGDLCRPSIAEADLVVLYSSPAAVHVDEVGCISMVGASTACLEGICYSGGNANSADWTARVRWPLCSTVQ